ncbi:MAG: hypothetical protein ACLP8S_12455 [Solirubrobacteraceae bacterium]
MSVVPMVDGPAWAKCTYREVCPVEMWAPTGRGARFDAGLVDELVC